jgi:hypothetical protein
MTDKPLDAWNFHEAMDRACMVEQTFDLFVLEHRAVDETPHLKALAEEVSEKLHDLYQAIATERWKYDEDGGADAP